MNKSLHHYYHVNELADVQTAVTNALWVVTQARGLARKLGYDDLDDINLVQVFHGTIVTYKYQVEELTRRLNAIVDASAQDDPMILYDAIEAAQKPFTVTLERESEK